MIFKILLLTITTLMVSSCSVKPIKADWADQVIGSQGYLYAPPNIVVNAKNYSNPSLFKRCDPVKVSGVYNVGGTIVYYVEIQQGENKFLLSGVGRDYFLTENTSVFVEANEKKNVADKMKMYLSSKLPFNPNATIKGSNSKITYKKAMCEEPMIWIGMKEAEFYFVMGSPEKINNTISKTIATRQLVYRTFAQPSIYSDMDYYRGLGIGDTSIQRNYYYITNGVLTTVQN